VLADRLKRLEQKGLIHKEQDQQDARQYVYKPTRLAVCVVPMLIEMTVWGARNSKDTTADRDLLRRFERNREQLIADLQAQVRRDGGIDGPGRHASGHARSTGRGVSIVAKKRAAPVWKKSPDDLIALFHAALPNDPRVERRKMFGYPSAFVGGNLFTGLHQENVIVRLAEKDRVAAIGKQGARLFEPMPGRPMREYIVLPESALADRGALAAWLQRGLSYAASLPPKARKPGRKAKPMPAGALRRKRT
jgi:TfoX/Sxy family transcriptional regulator of competence genes